MTPLNSEPTATARIWALVACAGTGSRAGGDLPKQYQNVAGQPVVVHSLQALLQVKAIEGILVVISASDAYFEPEIAQKFFNKKLLSVAGCGGFTRTESVLNGLIELCKRNLSKNDWILVHDAARCLVVPAQIQALIEACQGDGHRAEVGGLLAHPVPDTLKVAQPEASQIAQTKPTRQARVARTLDRSDKWLAQTPQMFRLGPLMEALEAARAAGLDITDEASAMEAAGFSPLLVPGSSHNFKVTYPEDFALAEALLTLRHNEITPK